VLTRTTVTTATAAALGALVAAALLFPQPAIVPETPKAPLSAPSVVRMAPPEHVLPVQLPDLEVEQPSALVADGWGDMEPAVEPVERRTVALGRGKTLIQLLLDAEVSQEEAHKAVAAMRAVHDPRRLRAGQEFTVLFDRTADTPRFVGFEFQPAVETVVAVSAADGVFTASEQSKPLTRQVMAARGTITSSLFQAGAEAGVPAQVLAALIRNYSYDVDFQRDIQEGDSFEILYENWVTEDGSVARQGGIQYAALRLSGKTLPIYRFEDKDGTAEYFNRKGESVRKGLLRTPIDGARISSKFGMRRHPVLGYSKMHKGVDFAAPTGTPIYAAGDGVIDEAGPKGAYGNYVRIRHNGQVSTAYAHMSRFGKNIRRGARVAQGDVIGYVGSTGRSTGPHLHFEVLKGNRQVNPMSVDLPTGRTLDGKELKQFQALVAELEGRLNGLLAEQDAGGIGLVSAPANQAVKPAACGKATGC